MPNYLNCLREDSTVMMWKNAHHHLVNILFMDIKSLDEPFHNLQGSSQFSIIWRKKEKKLLNDILCTVNVNKKSTGWICEIFKGHFELPDLGPIGANGLANPKDFETPMANYE